MMTSADSMLHIIGAVSTIGAAVVGITAPSQGLTAILTVPADSETTSSPSPSQTHHLN